MPYKYKPGVLIDSGLGKNFQKFDEPILVIKQSEIENYSKIEEAKRYNEALHNYSRRRGGFSFMRTDNDILNQLNPATAGRLALLSTYLQMTDDPERKQLLMNGNQPMLKEDLNNVLRVTRQTKNNFFDECSNYGLLEDRGAEGLYIASAVFYIGDKQNEDWMRLFHKTVQEAYTMLSTSQHRYFGFIVQLARYVNVEWNVICSNWNEQNRALIKPLTFKEVCGKLNYNADYAEAFRKTITKPLFQFNGHKEALCIFVPGRTSEGRQVTIIVNPNVMFSGRHLENVEAYKTLFEPHHI